MQIHPANFLIAVAISALIAYGLWSMDGSLKAYVAIGSFAYCAGTLGPAIGINLEFARNATNLRVVCVVFFMIGLALNLTFALIGSSQTLYILICAISFLVYVFLANSLYNAKQ